jgi:hypothetical protein
VIRCPNCGKENPDGACECAHCAAPLGAEDPAVRLGRWAEGLVLAGIFTCGITTVLAIPVAVWAVVSGRRRGVWPFDMAEAGVIVVVGTISLGFGAGFLRVRMQERARDIQMDCVSGIRGISVAARLYAEDHDGAAPPPNTWMESLRPYAKGLSFQCPAARPGTFGYAYNSGAAGRKWAKGAEAAKLVAFFDGKPGRDVSGGIESLVPRHTMTQHAAVFAFADGHSEAATREQARAFVWKASNTAQ